MNDYIAALDGVKQACVDAKRAIARLKELDELLAQGKFAEADLLMAELAELK